ncbi:helix-turn-helix transcriptional regulator [Vibrio parahaemolyticus]|uniref:helix-turn-helix transcriptional regulator n=1 Tax=Vibrio parahaemolyticus TaxID=670 RepID=UPI0036F30B14
MKKPSKLLPTSKVLEVLGVSRSSFEKLEQEGKFPEAIRVIPNRKSWPDTEIETMILVFSSGANDELIKQKVKEIEEARKGLI